MNTFSGWIPALQEEFQVTNAQMQVLSGCLASGFCAGGFIGKVLIRRLGFRIAYAASGAMVAGALLVVSFASNFWFVCFIFFAGAGCQGGFVTPGSLIPCHMSVAESSRAGALAL